jgi:hypothetical protein
MESIMLHDPGSYSLPPKLEDVKPDEKDKEVLRRLGEVYAGIASQPVHKEKTVIWKKLNDLDSERPALWINEIPWHEMNVDDELTLQCRDTWARQLETTLRKEIYQWRHMPGDMILNDFIECPLVIHSSDFGLHEEVDIAKTDEENEIVSRHFIRQIQEPEDIAKIKMPVITHHSDVTDLTYQIMSDLYRDIYPVKKVGQTHIWFTPWDYLIRWWGIQEAMMDLVLRPEMVHEGVERMVQAWMVELDQFEEQDLLSLDNRNIRVGSGGYGYTGELPGKEFDPEQVRSKNMWGCSNAQIFSEVSPEMHWEFAIEHDMKWLERWGLTYYGCCEPLDKKLHLMRKIPNLRKISVSPWNDFAFVAHELGGDYALSVKPSPAIFSGDSWNAETARKEIRDIVKTFEGCHIEIIMKDISTVNYCPQNLWDWSQIVMEEIT